jgi:hypothetical protein
MKSIVDQVVEVLDEACWDSHRQVGYKMKGGKRVPNCVPKNEESKLNEQPEHEITVGNYTTKFFYMCGTAQKVMKQNADVEGAEELTRLQDDFYKLEKEAMDAGEASDEQKEQARELYNKIMQKAGEIGLADDIDDYMKMHIDSVEKGDPKLGFGRTDIDESVLKENENTKVKQDRDVADEPGTQPAKYYKGLSKSEKEARAKHFAKGSSAPAPGDKGAKTKESKHTKKFKQMYGEEYIEEKNEGLKNKSSKSGISYGILKKVYDRGMAAWKTGHRPGTTPQQWAMARVNSFITKGKGTWGGADSDLAGKVRKEQFDSSCCSECEHMAEGLEHEDILIIENGEKKNVTLNKPQRGGSKKFYVYVKNDKGNIVKVSFGDPNMEIKRDDPARRKSFRARHNCDNPGPKWKARYWSCRQWRADSKVED